jgi:glycosyltransferase involved in cell wall biosynthesis
LFPSNEQDPKGVFVRDLAVEISLRGHEVHVVTPMRPGTAKEEFLDNVWVHRYPYYGWRKGTQLGQLRGTPILLLGSLIVLGIFKCITTVMKHNADLVHAYWVIPGGFIGLIAGWITRRPVVATAAGSDLNLAPKLSFVRLLTTLTLKGIDRLLPVSRSLEQLAVELGLPLNKAWTIHGPVGIDIQEFTKTQSEASICEEYKKCLLWVGHLTPPKRLDTILRAMVKVISNHSDCHLVVAGDGKLRSSYERLAEELVIRTHVHFQGSVPHSQVLQMLPTADLLIHCSEHEGLGLAIMEAMGAGLPVVASRVGGVPDLVCEGETGFMLSPDDVEGYAERIIALLKNDQLRKELGNKGRKFAEKYLNKDTILSQTEKVYQDVLNERKGIYGTKFNRSA